LGRHYYNFKTFGIQERIFFSKTWLPATAFAGQQYLF
jgi:hypothetical protein